MNITELKSKTFYKEYSLEIPFEDINQEIEQKIQNLIPKITLPGFRKGKAPTSIVRKKYEDSVLNEVIQNIINIKTADLIKEKKLNLFRQPKIDLKNFEKNKPLEIEIKIDLQPEIKLKDFKEIKLNKYEMKFSKKEIENGYKKFIESQKSFNKITNNREIIKTDRVNLSFETSNKEIPEYLRSQKNIPIELDSDYNILPEINNILLKKKLKAGDKIELSFDLTKVLKNSEFKKIDYKIEIISIEESVKFNITDEYLKNNGFKNENELKQFLHENALQQFNKGIRQIEKKQLMDFLNKEYKFDLPYGVLEDDFNEIWSRIESAKKDNSLDEDDKSLTEDKLKVRYKKISERRVRLAALLQFIAKENKIEILENELTQAIIKYTSQYPGKEKEIMEYFKKNPSAIESIKGPLLEDKIVDTIISKANTTIKKINEEEYKILEDQVFDIKRDKI